MFISPADNIIVQLTDAGRQLCARAPVEGISFTFYGWQLGRGGYNETNPVLVNPIDSSNLTLIDPIYPSSTTKQSFMLTDFEFPSNRSVSCTLRIYRDTVEANYGIGEIGIWIKILNSPLNPSENDTTVLFSITHTPIQTILKNSNKVWRIIHNF